MKRVFRKIIFTLIGLISAVIVFGLILAFYPTESIVKNNAISTSEAIAMRQSFTGAHEVFTTSDGETLFLRRWNPESADSTKKDIAVLILHGITAHSGAYDNAGKILSAGGYSTFGLDYRGHGLSGGNRADSPSKERWVADLAESVSFVRGLGYSRVIVLGHSLGVAAAIYVAKEIPDEVSGLVLLSGGYEKKNKDSANMPFMKKAKLLASAIFRPSYQAAEYYRDNMTGSHDPLFNFRYTVRFLTMMNVKDLVLPQSLNVPVLVAVGDKDELFTIESVQAVFDDMPGNKKTFLIFKETNHANIQNKDWQQVVAWLDSNI